MKVCFCYTVPGTLDFAIPTIRKMKEKGIEVVVISSNQEKLAQLASKLTIEYHVVNFSRGYNLISDIKALYKLIKVLKRLKPDVVFGATPKAGLLSMIASYLLGIKMRIYHIFGFPFETAKGFVRRLLICVERLASLCATHVLPISKSIASVSVTNKIASRSKVCRDYALTIGGVDMERFSPEDVNAEHLKKKYNICDDDIVIGFVGRITRDKGIYDFIHVMNRLKQYSLKYLIIGDNDAREPVDEELIKYIDTQSNIIHIKHTDKIEEFYKLMRILLIPSYREGFGNANVEAQAMRVPVVCYSVTGCVDSVKDKVSGFLVPFGDLHALENAVQKLVIDNELCETMGFNARMYVGSNFTTEIVAENNIDYINL